MKWKAIHPLLIVLALICLMKCTVFPEEIKQRKQPRIFPFGRTPQNGTPMSFVLEGIATVISEILTFHIILKEN